MKPFRKNRYLLLAALLALLMLCTACGTNETVTPEIPDTPSAKEQIPETARPEEGETQPEAKDPQPEPEIPSEENNFSFADLENLEFYFSSGAGAWRTVLYIHADGTFDGLYTDSEMGDRDELAYPNGTRYISEFTGRFEAPVNVDEHTWMLEVAELTYARPFGEEELADGFRYVYSKAYGIAGAEGLFLFAPGTPLAELPEAYLNWVGYFDLTQTADTELPFWGLYDSVGGNGFSSYPLPGAAGVLQAEIENAEAAAEELDAALQEAMTQTEMNLAAEELYRVWDDTLNIAWKLLKEELDPAAMQQLTAKQLDWIAEKETAAAEAAADYAGGSVESMAYGLKAAELTKHRVYELAGYLDIAP